MGNIINNLTWVFSKLPHLTSNKVSHIKGTCSKNPIKAPVLSQIQNTITEVGRQKSSFWGKVKATIKPIGTFLWKNFYCRLCNVLKKTGLFPSYNTSTAPEEPIPLQPQEASQVDQREIYEESMAFSLTRPTTDTATICSEPERFYTAQVIQKPSINHPIQFAKANEIFVNEDTATARFSSLEFSTATVCSEPERFYTAQVMQKPSINHPIQFAKANEIFVNEDTARFSSLEFSTATVCSEPERFHTAQVIQKPKVTLTKTEIFSTISEKSTLSLLLKKQEVTKEEFFNAASELFGKELIERIQSWQKVSLPENLTQNDVLHVLALLGHGVTTGDLSQLLIRANKGRVPLKLSKCTEDLSQLSTQDIKKLIDFFRNPLTHLSPDTKRVLWKALETSQYPIDSKRVAYTKYEYHIHKLAEEAQKLSEEEKELLPLAASEQIAKFVGYAKPDTICKDMIIPIFTKEQGLIYYRLHDHINEEGLHCYLFTSLNKNLVVPAQLVFRGTDGIASIKRDLLDPNGIGKTVFDKNKEKIAKMLDVYCASTEKPALEIFGHSLGALDAQRATVLCVELFNEKNSNISKLSSISCSAFCSPKLDAPTTELWETEINKLESSPLNLRLNFAYHENDIVTWAGHGNLFIPEQLSSDTNLQATYLHVSSDSGPLATATHHRTPFFIGSTFNKNIDNRCYDFYTNIKRSELEAKQANAWNSERFNSLANPTMDSIDFVLLDFKEHDKDMYELELALFKEWQLKQKIDQQQKGFSSETSWLAYWLEKVVVSPTQTTVSFFT
ncbi:MAG: hypothetical protein ACRDDW_01455 [Candidatus Rhabdochlamydia sp.]